MSLNDYGARWYDAAIGRWASVDPLAETGGQESWTGYHYVFGNPINKTDPDGREPSGDPITPLTFYQPGDPMGYLVEGFRQMLTAAGDLFSFKAEVHIETVKTTSSSYAGVEISQSTTVVENKVEAKSNLAEFMRSEGNVRWYKKTAQKNPLTL